MGRGLTAGFRFRRAESVLSLDGTETWQLYRSAAAPAENRNLLVKRPSGVWTLYLANGQELHYATVCDACGAADVYCADPLSGGKARLVKAVDAKGVSIDVSYDRPGGIFIQLSDPLGHVLALRSSSACADGLARDLRYDGAVVASYEYEGADLVRAADADHTTLRTYEYDPAGTGLLLAVKNESGGTAAEFSYDAEWRAIGIVDAQSSVGVSYAPDGTATVTEYFGDGQSATGQRTLDLSGRITSVSDGCSCGPPRSYTWQAGALACSSDPEGRSVYNEYDTLGRVIHRVEYTGTECPPPWVGGDAREEWRTYGIAKPIATGVNLALDNVTAISRMSPLNYTKYASETLSYDPKPQSIDPAGYACQQSPLPAGSVVCRETRAGYTYTSAGALFLQKTVTFFSYDARGRLIRTLGPKNLVYPSAGDVMPIEERTYWPDTETLARRGRLKDVKRYASPTAAPLVTSYDYDAFAPYQITQPNGAVTTIVKDVRGRPIMVIGPDGLARSTRYYDGLEPRLELLPGGGAVRSSYDAMGRRASIEYLDGDPEQPGANPAVRWSEHTTYDLAGNAVHVERRDASGAVSWQRDREYDVQRRIVREANPESPATARTNAFDASGFLTASTDEEGRATTFTYDGLGRVKKVRRSGFDAGGTPVGLDVAQYVYGTYSDSLSYVTDGIGQNTTYTHDDYGRVRRLSSYNFRSGEISFAYDPRGNLQQKKDGNVTVSYTYDGPDRVLTHKATNSSTGASVTYTYRYDEPPYPGALTSVVEPDRTVRYGYDAAGRLTSERIEEKNVPTPLVTQYVYGAGGAVSEVIYPSGLHVAFVRDPATREVVQVKNLTDGTLYADQVTRAPGGAVTSLVLGNGLTLSQTFNRRGEPQTILSGPLSLGYGMTPAGDVGSISDGVTTRSFQYDFLDRLTASPGWLAYGYDGNGNRILETVEGTAATYTYPYGSDQMDARFVASRKQHGYVYDWQSNATIVAAYASNGTTVTNVMCLRHDVLGRMVLAGTLPPGFEGYPDYCATDDYLQSVVGRFKYDARNRRIARQNPATSQWTYVVSDAAGNPLSELALTGTTWTKVRDYVWLDGRPLAQVEYPGPAGSTEGYVYYFHLDHIGLPRALTNQAGQTVWSAAARPYGDLVETTATDPLSGRTVVTNLRLPGQYDERLLGSIGLQGPYYNWNRWYLPGVGRYLEPDPIALLGGINGPFAPDWYSYADGNPMRKLDPTGMGACEVMCELKSFPPVAPCSWQFQTCSDKCDRWYRPFTPRWQDCFFDCNKQQEECLTPIRDERNECKKKCKSPTPPSPPLDPCHKPPPPLLPSH